MSNAFATSSETNAIQIVVNGEPRAVPEGLTIKALLHFLQIDPSRVAVEHNREIVRKTKWAEAQVKAGDQFEVVWFVGGG